MRNLFILFLTSISLFATSADLIMTDLTRYDKTITSTSLKDAKITYDVPAISYMHVEPNYLILLKLKHLPKQHIGNTALGNTPIKLEQEAWKYEIGGAYKFYITDDFYIAPALLYTDYYYKLYQTVGTNVIETHGHDSDIRVYGVVGYKIAKATMLFATIELDNDILSDNYSNDYNQYSVSATLYQFLSKDWFIYGNIQSTLRDKEARADSTGNKSSIAYGFGLGMKF